MRLHTTFRTVLQLAGVGAALPLGACNVGSDCGNPMGSELHGAEALALARSEDYRPLACHGEWQWPAHLSDLAPVEPVDYLEFRSGDLTLEWHGAACSVAEPAASSCRAQLALPVRAEPGNLLQGILHIPLLATRGPDVLLIDSVAQLRAFLGPVDRLSEAQLVAETQGYGLLCGESGGAPRDGGFDVVAYTYAEHDGRTRHLLHVDPQGNVRVKESLVQRYPDPCVDAIVGRRPEGFRGRACPPTALGALVASWAELEAASVPAFTRLARELAAHGAPRSLVLRAHASARDEVRHARAMTRLARRLGGYPQPTQLEVGPVRELERVALENAVEGCVFETHAALVAHHQARRARAAGVAALFRGIAADETRHAQLSWDVAGWTAARLSPAARRRVAAARRAAVHALKQRPTVTQVAGAEWLGLPTADAAAALVTGLDRTLWQRA